jgi:hypothetical protein
VDQFRLRLHQIDAAFCDFGTATWLRTVKMSYKLALKVEAAPLLCRHYYVYYFFIDNFTVFFDALDITGRAHYLRSGP